MLLRVPPQLHPLLMSSFSDELLHKRYIFLLSVAVQNIIGYFQFTSSLTGYYY